MKTEARAIGDLQLDDRCQAREHFDDEAIEDLRQSYADGVELPPVEVVEVGGALYVDDGFHRIAAATLAGHEFIRVHIVEKADTVERARWVALSKNTTHGVRRTAQDKRKAVRLALDNEIGREQSSRTIAEHLRVSKSLVSEMRTEWEAEHALSTADNAPATVTTKDGRQYPKKRRERDDVSAAAAGVQPERKPKPSTPAARYAQAARMIERLHQKLSGLLGDDDPICDRARELYFATREQEKAA